jgi:hypothetical protein
VRRIFKNCETLCRVAQLLESGGVTGFEIQLTTVRRENRYARWLREQFGVTPHVRFIGRQTKMKCGRSTLKLPQCYVQANLKLGDCLIARPRVNRYRYLWQISPTTTKQSVPMTSLVFFLSIRLWLLLISCNLCWTNHGSRLAINSLLLRPIRTRLSEIVGFANWWLALFDFKPDAVEWRNR